jgi:hypothetical protein
MEQHFRPRFRIHSRRFDGELILLDLGAGKYFSLDEVGAVIWEHLCQGKSAGEVVQQILQTYEVDGERARRDVERIAGELVAAGLLEMAESM